jgi:hypothetical protein
MKHVFIIFDTITVSTIMLSGFSVPHHWLWLVIPVYAMLYLLYRERDLDYSQNFGQRLFTSLLVYVFIIGIMNDTFIDPYFISYIRPEQILIPLTIQAVSGFALMFTVFNNIFIKLRQRS